MGQSTTTVVGYQVGKAAVPKISLHLSCKWLQQSGVVEVQRTRVATGVPASRRSVKTGPLVVGALPQRVSTLGDSLPDTFFGSNDTSVTLSV